MFRTRLPLVASLLSATFLMSFLPAQSATIAGTKCTKLNSTKTVSNIKYTCVKSGKKLFWNKGVAIIPALKPTPTPTPTPTVASTPATTQTAEPTLTTKSFSPWDTNVTAKELSDAAQNEFANWLAKFEPGRLNHKLIVQDGVPSNRLNTFKAADQMDSKLFSSLISGGSVTVIGKDESWVVKTLNANGGKFTSCNQSPGNSSLSYCLDNFVGYQGFVLNGDSFFDPKNPSYDGSSLLSHEYFHSVQSGILKKGNSGETGDPGFNKKFPVWLIEGSANFVSFSIVANKNNANYWDGYKAMLSYAPQRADINRNLLEEYEIRTCCGNDKPTYPYVIGQLATEYIVASAGFDKLLDLWRTAGDGDNFETIFLRVMGISKASFYQKFEAMRLNIGLPPVTWKLFCNKNTIENREITSLTAEEAALKFDSDICLYGPKSTGTSETQNTPNSNPDNLNELPCVNLGEEKTTFYLWVCVNESTRGRIWIRKGDESKYKLVS